MSSHEFNRVLIQGVPLEPIGNGVLKASPSFLTLMVEELISRSAVEVAVGFGNAAFLVDDLPDLLKKRVRTVDCRRAIEHSLALLQPIGEEFQVEFGGVGFMGFRRTIEHELKMALFTIGCSLPVFLGGVYDRLQIGIDLAAFRRAVKHVRASARNPSGRAILAAIEGVLNTYNITQIPEIRYNSEARPDLVENFQRLVEDQAYLIMSRNAHRLGLTDKSKRAIVLMRRAAKAVLSRKWSRKVLDLGSQTLQTASGLPMPKTEIAAQLLEPGYLPSIVNLSPILRATHSAWDGGGC